MKSIKTILAALLFTAAILPWVSCKKEDTTPTPKSPQDKIAGKWQPVSTVSNDFYAGTSHIMTYTGTSADYVDFRNDGNAYSFVNGSYDTVAYAMISDTKMWIYNSVLLYDIQTLTDTDLKIYRKETYSGGDYTESTITMKR